MTNESNIEVAYRFISAHSEPVSFSEIWEEVLRVQGFSEAEAAEQIGRFYTNLSLDGRFVTLGENTWDLRSRHTFDKVHIDMNDVYSDVDSESEELIVDDDMSDDDYSEEESDDDDKDAE